MTSVRWPSGGKAVERRAHDTPGVAVVEAAWVEQLLGPQNVSGRVDQPSKIIK